MCSVIIFPADALDKRDYLGAGIEATAGLLGIIPGVGDLAGKGLRVATKNFRKADVDEAEKLLENPEKLQKWRDPIDKGGNRLPESQRQKNIPEAQQAAEDLFQGNIKSKDNPLNNLSSVELPIGGKGRESLMVPFTLSKGGG